MGTAKKDKTFFNERSHKLVNIAAESFGRLGGEGSGVIEHLATTVIGRRNEGFVAKKGICNERLGHIISATSRVTISSGVHRYRLARRDRKATKGKEVRGGGAAASRMGLAQRC